MTNERTMTLSKESHALLKKVDQVEQKKKLDELMERTGMVITQENGQRRYAKPSGSEGPMPPKGSEVFVGKLPRDCLEAEIVPVFERVGQIHEIRLMMDFSGTNRGYCFVQFCSPEEATRAVKELNRFEIRKGRPLGVAKSVDNCRLFVGGIPRNLTKDEIRSEISKVTEGVVRVISYLSLQDRKENRGFAFVEYETHKAAAMARRKMIPGTTKMWGVNVAVDWAEPQPDVDIEIMNKVTALYVRNLLLTTKEDHLREIFNAVSDNQVERVKKVKDFAFVHFKTRSAAEKARNNEEVQTIEGSPVEICWAKPVDKRSYQSQKAWARTMFSPRSTNGVKNNARTNHFNTFHYNDNSGSSSPQFRNPHLMQSSYENQGYLLTGQPQFGSTSTIGSCMGMGFPSYQSSFHSFGDSPVSLMPLPNGANCPYNILDQLQMQRMNLGNEYRPYRGRPAGGVQGMRFSNPGGRPFAGQQGFNHPSFYYQPNPEEY